MKCDQTKMRCLQWAVIFTTVAALITAVSIAVHGTGRYPGDANLDKHIDVSDAVLVARVSVGDDGVVLTDMGMKNADANEDDTINSADVNHIMQQITGLIPMRQYVEETTEVPETTAEPATTSVTAPPETTVTTVTTAAETEAPPAETQPASPELTADTVPYPLAVSISVLTGKNQPNEMLTVSYDIGNIIFAIFADDPLDTTVAIAYQDNIVGYYKFCEEYTVPEGYAVREYKDSLGQGNDSTGLYAVFIMREDISIDFPNLSNQNDFMVLSKLNFYGTNGLRARYGLPLFNWDPELAKLAEKHSLDMATNNFIGHESSDGTTRQDRMLNAGIDYQYGGENIDWGYRNPFDALNGWLNSPDHRKNLMNEKLTHLGVGFAYGENSDYTYYGTQDFCKYFG